MNEKFEHLKNNLETVQTSQKQVKDNYLDLITDLTIELDTRWKIFITFPNHYKVNRSANFIPQCFIDNFSQFDWYKDLGYLPNVIIDTVCFVQMIENVIRKNVCDSNLDSYLNNKVYVFYRKNPEALDLLKEEILQQNLACFVYKIKD